MTTDTLMIYSIIQYIHAMQCNLQIKVEVKSVLRIISAHNKVFYWRLTCGNVNLTTD